MLTTEDLILCHGQAQTVLLPDDFFMLRVFGSNSWGHHNNLGTLHLGLGTKSPALAVVRILSFLGSEVCWGCNQESLSIKVLRSNKKCQKTSPKYPFDLHKKATAQVLLSA